MLISINSNVRGHTNTYLLINWIMSYSGLFLLFRLALGFTSHTCMLKVTYLTGTVSTELKGLQKVELNVTFAT